MKTKCVELGVTLSDSSLSIVGESRMTEFSISILICCPIWMQGRDDQRLTGTN